MHHQNFKKNILCFTYVCIFLLTSSLISFFLSTLICMILGISFVAIFSSAIIGIFTYMILMKSIPYCTIRPFIGIFSFLISFTLYSWMLHWVISSYHSTILCILLYFTPYYILTGWMLWRVRFQNKHYL